MINVLRFYNGNEYLRNKNTSGIFYNRRCMKYAFRIRPCAYIAAWRGQSKPNSFARRAAWVRSRAPILVRMAET